MLVKRITVSSTRKVPHPIQEFSTLSALVSLDAEVSEGEDYLHCGQTLQAQAEEMVDRHLRRLTSNLAAQYRKDQEAQRAKAGTENTESKLIAKHGGAF